MASNEPCSACQLAPGNSALGLCNSCQAEVDHADEHEWSKTIAAVFKQISPDNRKRFSIFNRDEQKSFVAFVVIYKNESPKVKAWRYSNMH